MSLLPAAEKARQVFEAMSGMCADCGHELGVHHSWISMIETIDIKNLFLLACVERDSKMAPPFAFEPGTICEGDYHCDCRRYRPQGHEWLEHRPPLSPAGP